MLQLDRQYQNALQSIMEDGIEETNQRTGHKTKALPGIHLKVDLQESFPLLTLRKVPIRIFTAEQVWFIMGRRRPDEFLRQFTKIWDDFTNINGVVTVAYGFRMRHHFGRDQLAELIKLLENDPSSRHGVVIFWDPADDGLYQTRKKKNVPCPYTFTVNIFGGKLHFHLIIRSNDMILGFPHDFGGFSLMAYILAAHLGYEPGMFSYSVSNAHVYDIHYDAAHEMINRAIDHDPIKFQAEEDYLDRAEEGDEELVHEIVNSLSSQYNPGERIKGLEIVL